MAGRVELTETDHDVAFLAVDLVAVDVEDVTDRVVALLLLQLLERRADQGGVEETDLLDVGDLFGLLGGADAGLALEVGVLDVLDVVRRTGRSDVLLQVGRLLARPRGRDLDRLPAGST